MLKRMFILVAAIALIGGMSVALHETSSYFFAHESFVATMPTQEPVSAFSLNVPIIVYHSVRPHIDGESRLQDAFDITPELFERQLRYLADNHIQTITPHELAQELKTHDATTTKQVMLTFDDGWQNQYIYAFPLLAKYHAKAVFYIYTHPISLGKHFMTWDELRELNRTGLTIGAHTITHPYLAKLPIHELAYEIIQSKHILEQKLGVPITDFASPFGYSDDRVIWLVKGAGFETARTLYPGSMQSPDTLERLPAYLVSDNFSQFVRLVSR